MAPARVSQMRRYVPLAVASALAALVQPSGAVTFQASVTPVEKVIALLGRLQTQVQEEGAKEAAEYDKFACFCKEQVDAKTYAIEKSEEKIEALGAEVDKLTADITELDADVVTLGTRIGELETEITTEKAARKTENDDYLVADENVTTAIASVEAAIKALKASKSEVGLSQLSPDAKHKLWALSRLTFPEGTSKATASLVTSAFMEVSDPGRPAAYKYQSNDIIQTLQDLRKSFVANKKDQDEAEFTAHSAHAKKVLGLANEKQFKEKSKIEKEELSSKKTAEKEDLEKQKDDETKAKDADVEFRTELTDQCKSKAEEWDQRSQSRAQELTAIAEATEILKSGVSSTYGANKKLVGLASVKRATTGNSTSPKKAVSLLQLREDASSASVVRQVLTELTSAAGNLKSTELRALVARASLSEDHFVKVRGLINDLIARLEAQAAEEATQKTFCDKEMGTAISDRDKHASDIEDANAKVATEEAKRARLLEEIAELHKEIAGLKKALQEATQLRAEEKVANEKTLAQAKEGKTAVDQAITVLQTYYGSFAQTGRQPKVDRDGKTVSDLAPKTSFSGDYDGKKDASKGIMGLLEVIASDFERTSTTVAAAETDAASAFETFKTETETSVTTKEDDITGKEAEVTTAEGEIVSAKDASMSGKRLHATAIEELEKLQVMCIQGEESYAERVAKREKEIEALREAMKILEDWKA